MLVTPRRRTAAQDCLAAFALLLNVAPLVHADEAVTWTNLVGASANGNSLTKTGATTAWNSGAASVDVIRDGYGYVEFTATETNKHRIVSLSNGDTNQTDSDVDFGVILISNGNFGVQQGAWFSGYLGTYATGDRFRVEVQYGVTQYRKNGTVFYTSANSPQYPLRVDAALYEPGATISDVRVGNLAWAGESGVTVRGSDLTKAGAAGWTSGAISANAIEAGDGFMEFTATETTTTRAAGLANGNSGQDLADIEFAVKLNDDATVEVTEGGTSKGTFGSYAPGDRFRVELRDGTVSYFKNGISFYTSTGTAVYPLRVDTALDSVGATVTDIVIESILWTNESGVSFASELVKKTASDGWNAGASSTWSLAGGDGLIEFTALETNTRRTVGLKVGTGVAQSYADIDFAVDLNAAGLVEVFETGVSRGQFGSYSHGDRFRVEISEGAVQYVKNGSVFYSSTVAPAYPVHVELSMYTGGASVAAVQVRDLVWMNVIGAQTAASGLRKPTGGAIAWDTGVASTRATNSGYVEFVVSERNTGRMIGLSRGDMGVTYADIDFGIHPAANGIIYVYEAGISRGPWGYGSYATGDRFRVSLEAGVIKYYKNGTVFYTSTVTPVLPLRADISLLEPGATVLGVVLVGAAVADVLEAPTFSPPATTYTTAQTVTLSAMPGATIRYTTDGSDPTESSPLYSAPISVTQTTTIRAKAWRGGFTASNTAAGLYTLKVITPTLNVAGGTYANTLSVTVTCPTAATTARYTTNGWDPAESDPVVACGGSVSITGTSTLKVRGWKTGWAASDVVVASYTLKAANPVMSPVGGSYGSSQVVMITTATAGAIIRYTTDGREPTDADAGITSGGSVLVNRSSTLRARAFKATWTPSDVVRWTYDLSVGTVAAPSISPAAGSYSEPQTITLATTTAGAEIRYTTDGSEPSAFSRLYTGPFAVASSMTIKARAVKEEWTPSAVGTAAFTLSLSGAAATPTLSPGTGRFTTSQSVMLVTETAGAAIHYTTNGAEPTEADATVVSGGTLTVDRSLILKAKAFKAGIVASGTTRADYIVTGALAGGRMHSLALKADGTLWGWGNSQFGQVGHGANWQPTSPVSVSGLTSALAVAAGYEHSLAVKSDGTAWTWGRNSNGQLGDGTNSDRWAPVQVPGLSNVIGVAGGRYHSVAVKSDGTVWSWGSNFNGELGNGTLSASLSPVQATGITTAVAVAAGDQFTLAVLADGTVRSWGLNNYGQLGDGTNTRRTSPVTVPGLRGVTTVAAGWTSAFALRTDGRVSGTVWSWGNNASGQLGDGTTTTSTTPIAVLRDAVAIGAGVNHVLVSMRDGSVQAWGANSDGRLGDGSTTAKRSPSHAQLVDRVVQLAGGEGHTLAVRADGSPWSWGQNASGQLGRGYSSAPAVVPAPFGLAVVPTGSLLTDPDADGMSTWSEYLWGSDPLSPDTNANGISDGIEFGLGRSPSAPDRDGDGLTDSAELALGTDPDRADTDGDGVPDGADAFPLDPDRSQPGTPDPSDQTPPTITLTEPPGAVPVP